MSHLIIEEGREIGREITVPEDGLKFGRSPVNDIVLKHPSVMLFHGRFFFKSDNTLWVTDFGAAERTTVGGEPIDEHPLKSGDLIKVGATAFRVRHAAFNENDPEVGFCPVQDAAKQINESRNAAPKPSGAPVQEEVLDAKPVSASSSTEEIDLGFKSSPPQIKPNFEANKPVKKSSLTHKLLAVLVILLLLGVLGGVGLSLMDMSKRDVVVTAPEPDSLLLAYERVMGDEKNIFRYRMELDDNGTFSIQIDDLKNNRHVTKNEDIPETLRLQLSNSIQDANFFAVNGNREGEDAGKYDLVDIAVLRNRKFHRVRVLNRSMPEEVKRTKEIIEDFARSELGISFTWNLSVEELMKLANETYQLAEARYAEREVRRSNLWSAMKLYEEAQLYMETMEPKPALFRSADQGITRVSEELDHRYKDKMFLADKAIRLKDYEEAAKQLYFLSEMLPDRSDPRYQKVSSKLLNVEKYLK